MAFSAATVVTTIGKAIMADRLGNATTYTTPPHFCAMGTGAEAAGGTGRTAAAADTALSSEAETRANGAITVSGNQYSVQGTQTATAARAVDEAGLFDATTGGHMATSATLLPVNLNSGDSIQWNWQVTFN